MKGLFDVNWLEVALMSFLGLIYYEWKADYGRKRVRRHKPTIYGRR